MAWIAAQFALNPRTLRELHVDQFRLALLRRTVLYSVGVGIIATLLAFPAAWVIGRGKGLLAPVLGFVLPISLLMPSLVIAYGWKQLLRLMNLDFDPAGFWDVMRCIWSLATWLWPLPAIVVGLSLRRSDPQVQQQALLDGALLRVMLRQLAGPIIGSACAVSMLAMQEFAVYEPTGISVVATEVRMVFETGAYSSPANPITQAMGVASVGSGSLPDQSARAAAAVETALPMLAMVGLLALMAYLGARKLSAAENMETGHWPPALNAPTLSQAGSWLIVAVALAVPIAALIVSMGRPFDIHRIWEEFSPQLTGSIEVAGVTGIVGMMIAMGAVLRQSRGFVGVSVVSFLIGGQILAIALIRLYNRPWLGWVYEGLLIVVMAYVGRFGWILLSAAAVTWSRPWRQLRDLAAVDGASAMQTARYVIWPLAWPILGASAMFVLILSLSEVPATVLISPQKPQMLVPMLMTWVHMLRYDAMIEASLVMAAMVVVLGAIALAMGWAGRRAIRIMCMVLLVGLVCGCHDRAKPQAIWCDTGIGHGQVVYPRGIAYSAADDSFFIVDRQAHIQHLDHDGKFITDWHTPVWEQGKPVGLTVGPDGNLYVPDTHYHRVLVYSATGELLKKWGEKGTDSGQFIYPTDIAFDSKGNIFVSEYGDNDRIQVFDRDGKFLYQFGKFGQGNGEFSRPQSIVIDRDLLYLTDACNHRLEVFKTDGTFVRTMGKVGSGPGEFRFPYGLDMDSSGRLVVCEFGNNRVQLIDKETGKGLAQWGLAGREPGELAYPWGVVVDKRDRVIAVDAGNNRLQVFEF
ncbi:MAG TPA: 6-bladed beta-propeller [Tepidisphaeraceae bacterium]|nr:6-bladed beta-propeller [Tepidisphaeraceae bacterium]